MDAIEEAVRIRKVTLGPDDPKVAVSSETFAKGYEAMDLPQRPIFFMQDSLVELGIVLLSMKEYSDSLETFMEALEMREAEADDVVLPEEVKETNLKVAKVLNNIGCVNFESKKFEAANDAFVDAIQLQKKTLGEVSSFSFTNPATKPGFLTMASTMCNKGYIDLESLAIQKLLLGADNKLVLSTLDNLGYAYAVQGSYDKALAVSIRLFFPG
jgi:tetratricopeptide (TPR) repeat protein